MTSVGHSGGRNSWSETTTTAFCGVEREKDQKDPLAEVLQRNNYSWLTLQTLTSWFVSEHFSYKDGSTVSLQQMCY